MTRVQLYYIQCGGFWELRCTCTFVYTWSETEVSKCSHYIVDVVYITLSKIKAKLLVHTQTVYKKFLGMHKLVLQVWKPCVLCHGARLNYLSPLPWQPSTYMYQLL